MTTPTLRQANSSQLDRLIAKLSLQQKITVLTGGSAWGTAALPTIGLREMILSDGPSGVRGATWDERDSSVCFPSATSLAASWDVELARGYGQTVAGEARRMGVDVVLGPTINLHRSPLGGRHFEAFSEDPVLTAALAAAYVEGMQEQGVGATPKHYVANDFETDRFNADVQVSERALRELYLLAFERAITESSAWLVMSAYNSINGVTATENELLTDPLKTEWAFDGVVVSDWTAVRSVESAKQPQDLAMPGPDGAWGPHLVDAVARGDVDVAVIDEKVRRILRLASRVGALEGFKTQPVTLTESAEAFARRAASEGMVLLRNDDILPIEVTPNMRVAVIGDSAKRPRIQGGGSATVLPDREVTPLDGIHAALGDSAAVGYAVGAVVHDGFAAFPPRTMRNPATGEPGAHVTYFAADGSELYTDERQAGFLLEFGTRELDLLRTSMTFTTIYTPEVTGRQLLGFASPGTGRLFIDGALVLEETMLDDSDQVQAFFSPPAATVEVELVTGRPVELNYEFTPGSIVDGVPGSISVTFGSQPLPRTEEDDLALIADAVALASQADIVVVVVGTDDASECEGYDRTHLNLPGRQDELVAAVAAVNPQTVVVVNSGAPVEMPWRDDVAAVLLAWFAGQEFGDALADVLTGTREPGGRLPTTWPAVMEDAPVLDVTPRNGVVEYSEGIHIGYKAWARTGTAPAYPFGHGLGFTTWEIGELTVESEDQFTASIPVTNTGRRSGKQVVQVYASRPESAVDRPALWLVGFATVRAKPGETVHAQVGIPLRSVAHWNEGWVTEPGTFLLQAGLSVAELGDAVAVEL